MELNQEIACKFAKLALSHVAQEYPNKLDHVMAGKDDAQPPRALHPVFFGSFDWHSCVHSWWTLLTIRRLYPDTPEAKQIDALAAETFTNAKLAVELAYLEKPESRGFERPYGWGWLLYLHLEASRHTDREWGALLEPLANAFSRRFGEYLSILTYPITVGTHGNTAFALILAREWAEGRDPHLVSTIDQWSISAFAGRENYSGWEPGGDEFLSPVLIASLLMSRIMPRDEFSVWFENLVISNGWLERECRPAFVSDRSDGKIAHLDGLNLSRAWCLRKIEQARHASDASGLVDACATEHLQAGISHVSGDYMGEHWLASFALLALLPSDSAA